MTADQTRRLALLIIALGLLVRLAVAGVLGFGVDETYTLGVTRHIQLSWFDHPPVAFWMAWAMQQLFDADGAHLLLRLPFVLLFCGSSWLLYRLTLRLYGPLAAFWALLSFTLAPFFFLSAGGWIVPDGPLIFFLLLAANLIVKVLFEDGRPWQCWLGVGLAIGLAGLSKYLAVFFPLGLGLFLLLSPRHRIWLRHPAPWVAALIALATLAPVFVWNAAHGWISFTFQTGRAAASGNLRPDLMLTVLGGQAAYLLPWTFGGLIIAATFALRSTTRDAPAVLLACLSLPVIVLLSLLPLFGAHGLPHWQMPGWLFLFPLLGLWITQLEAQGSRLHKITLGFSIAAMSFLILVGGSQARYGWLKQVLPGNLKNLDPTHELVEWQGLREGLTALDALRPHGVYISPHWLEAGRISRQIPHADVYVWSADPRGFGVDRKSADLLINIDEAIIITKRYGPARMMRHYSPYFETLERLGSVSITRAGQHEFVVDVYRARKMRLFYEPAAIF